MTNENTPQETIVDEKSIYNGSLLHVKYRTVQLPNGSQVGRELVIHPGAVAMVPILPNGDVMLIQQYRTATQSMLYEIPAGTLEAGEDIEVAANRELREEIGYRADKLQKLGGIYVAPGYSTEFIHIYLATALVHAPLEADEDEMIALFPKPLAAALSMVYDGEITDAKTTAGLLLAAKQLN